MKQSSLKVILLLLVFICFISLSALSGEDPWDADDHFSLAGNSGSSNISSSDNAVYLNYLDSPFDIIFDISFKFFMWTYDIEDGQDYNDRTRSNSRVLKEVTRYK